MEATTMIRWFNTLLAYTVLFSCSSALSEPLRLYDSFAKTVSVDVVTSDQSAPVRFPMKNVTFGVWESDFSWPDTACDYRFVIDDEMFISDIGQRDFVRQNDGTIWSRWTNHHASSVAGTTSDQTSPRSYKTKIGYSNPDAKSVLIAGSFNQWAMVPMKRVKEGVWRMELDLPEGSYGYKFIIDDAWILDPANEQRITTDGVENSLLVVSSNNTPPLAVSDASPGHQNPDHTVNIHFRFYAPTEKHVAVVGTFNDWNGDQHPMSKNGDVWECVIPITEGTHEYKFKAGENWLIDPNNPTLVDGSASGNSILEVKRTLPPEVPATPLIDPSAWTDTGPILLETATGLHPFQQELIRARVFVQATDGFGLRVADGSLLQSGPPLMNPAGRWSWDTRTDETGLPVMAITVNSNTVTIPLHHPILVPPHDWLREVRDQTARIIREGTFNMNGPTSPPPDSAWAEARKVLSGRLPMADVYAVNTMIQFGRTNGWSHKLLREIAVVYADMANDHRFPGMGGWSHHVFAARAVVYADLARGDEHIDETMAYVLAKIGRPNDAAAFLPERSQGFYGRLADAIVHGRRDQLQQWAGTPDHYGFDLADGLASQAPQSNAFTRTQMLYILRTLSDLLDADEQINLSRFYLDASLQRQPYDFASHQKALAKGGVSAGHRHAPAVLGLAGNIRLWNTVMNGEAPSVIDPKKLVTSSPRVSSTRLTASEEDIAEISRLYKTKQREVLDYTSQPVPESARLILLRDLLNTAWWRNAKFYGRQLYSREGCEEINRLMVTWKPMHPEMDAFTRFAMRGPMNEHAYEAIREGLEKRNRGPDTFSFIAMVRASFGTWLMERAQGYYLHTPLVQSDLLPDYLNSEAIFVFLGIDHLRANIRRLDPMNSRGYPEPGPWLKDDETETIPARLREESYGLNKRLAEISNLSGDPESRSRTIDYYRRCLRVAPYETGVYRTLAGILMDNGRYDEALELVRTFPDATEGLEETSIERIGAYAALEIGDISTAISLSKSSAQSWQAGALLAHAYLLEQLGRYQESEKIQQQQDSRYYDQDKLYYLARQKPDEANVLAKEIFSWIEQFSDLDQANKNNRFVFNEFTYHPFYYMAVGNWDRALWMLKPLAEAVQNDFTWFQLMTVGQYTRDEEAVNLAQHVLANHVQNVFGECARFHRGDRTWADVVNAARIEGKPQPVYLFAAILAEQRGDIELAKRLLMHAMNPRFGTTGWFTTAWREFKRLGGDPDAFARRTIPEESMSTGQP